MRQIERNIVSAVLITKDNKIFLAKRTSGGVWADSWQIPGGGVEPGEDKINALNREVQEELNLDIQNYSKELVIDGDTGEAEKILKTGETVIAKMHFFTYRVCISDKSSDDVPIILSDEFSEHVWVMPGELKNYQLPPPSIALFKKLGML